VRWHKAPKMYTMCSSSGDAQTSCKVWLASGERRRCSNEGKTRKPLKFARVPKTHEQISAVSGPKFAILWGRVEEISLFNKFFQFSIHAVVVETQPNKPFSDCLTCEGMTGQNAMVPKWRFFAFFASCIFSRSHAARFRHAF